MAKIIPFCAIRPAENLADSVAALPYDVYNRAEAKDYVQKHPMSFLSIDRAESLLPDTVDTYDEAVYAKAKELFEERIRNKVFIRDDAPCFYIYELTMNGRVQTGIVGCASIDDYENNIIKKHENTRADKEADRIRHVDALSAQTGPIFLAYRHNDALKQIVDEHKSQTPLCDFVSDDGIRHRCFVIDDSESINEISRIFSMTDGIYIADGHHRCASAVRVGMQRRAANPNHNGSEEYNYFLSVLFSDDELMIMDYNRVIKDLAGMSIPEFMNRLKEVGDLTLLGKEAAHPTKKGEVTVFDGDNWYLLSFSQSLLSDDPVEGLDVSILQNNVLGPMLGIDDPKTDKRIDFVGGIRGLDELQRRCKSDCKVAFAMYPTDISELFAVADAHRLMPPKSTWFEPKLRSGLFIHDISLK